MNTHSDHIGVIGLGYVGLPIALALQSKHKVTGYDINSNKINQLRKNIDPSQEVDPKLLADSALSYTNELSGIAACNIYIVAVPTPVDEHKIPNLKALKSACSAISSILKANDLVIFESTVYPGCTDEICIPILEKHSGLKVNKDFKVGYSPERINPGDQKRNIYNVVKIVAGSDLEALAQVAELYSSIIVAGVHQVSNIKVAEAAKIMENTQRNVNIALMNEMSMIFDKMDINTREVIAAAATKWNFQSYYPGLVGGHCIDVDPYYLTHKAELLGYNPEVILAGKKVNTQIPKFITKKIVQLLLDNGKRLIECRVLIKGITYKENVSDHRNSKVIDLYNELLGYKLQVDIHDPMAKHEEIKAVYGIDLISEYSDKYDVMILAVSHEEYQKEEWTEWQTVLKDDAIIYDVKGMSSALKLPDSVIRLYL